MSNVNDALDYCSVQPLIVPAAHPCLPGHFPGSPIVPGVLLLAQWQQLLATHLPNARLCAIPSIKFLQPVRAEQALWLGVEIQSISAQQVRGRCLIRGHGSTIASGQFVAELLP